MIDARLLAELVQSCRLIACHQQNPNTLDMLHDLEEDFLQKARDVESRNGRQPLRQDDERLRASSVLRSS
jgi:hypothetical protein